MTKKQAIANAKKVFPHLTPSSPFGYTSSDDGTALLISCGPPNVVVVVNHKTDLERLHFMTSLVLKQLTGRTTRKRRLSAVIRRVSRSFVFATVYDGDNEYSIQLHLGLFKACGVVPKYGEPFVLEITQDHFSDTYRVIAAQRKQLSKKNRIKTET